jgi:hypothetical protein
MQARSFVCLLGLFFFGCGSSSSGSKIDAGSTVDAFFSICGHPGDQGNELGIGKFCKVLDDCGSNGAANLCSSLGNDPAHPDQNSFFCTFECSATSPAGTCGTGAACQCASAGCACAPTTCGSGI